MVIEYVIFTSFFIPWINGISKYLGFRAVRNEEKTKSDKTKVIVAGLFLVASSLPYIGAYVFADLRYFWLALGLYYIALGLFTVVMGCIAAKGGRSNANLAHENIHDKNYRDVDFWPRWQVKLLCVFQVLILLLWLYAWRNIYP